MSETGPVLIAPGGNLGLGRAAEGPGLEEDSSTALETQIIIFHIILLSTFLKKNRTFDILFSNFQANF